MNKMELRFNASLSNESFVRTAVISFISILNPSLDEIAEVKTIVSEAVSNAIIHGYKLDASKEITIKCSLLDSCLEMEIIDYGIGIENIEDALKDAEIIKEKINNLYCKSYHITYCDVYNYNGLKKAYDKTLLNSEQLHFII